MPVSEAGLVTELDCHLSAGQNVELHCRQGIGRTRLITKGWNPADAVKHLRTARRLAVQEAKEQLQWIIIRADDGT